MGLAIHDFSHERSCSPLYFDNGGDRQFLLEDQAEAVHREIGKPRLTTAVLQVCAAHVYSQVRFKPRSVSPIHSRSIGQVPSIP